MLPAAKMGVRPQLCETSLRCCALSEGEPKPTGWQPIKTAPRDDTEFLAYDSVARKFDVCEMVQHVSGRWECRAVQFDREYGALSYEFGEDSRNITHWRPLPDPPIPSA